jgi:hypothetical protein
MLFDKQLKCKMKKEKLSIIAQGFNFKTEKSYSVLFVSLRSRLAGFVFNRYCLIILILFCSMNAYQQTIDREIGQNLKSVKIFSFLGINIVPDARDLKNDDLLFIPPKVEEANYFTGDKNLYFERWMTGPDEDWKGKPYFEPAIEERFEKWMFQPGEWGKSGYF